MRKCSNCGKICDDNQYSCDECGSVTQIIENSNSNNLTPKNSIKRKTPSIPPKLRLSLEITGLLVIVLLTISTSGKVSKGEYETLRYELERTEADYNTAVEDYNSLKSEYNSYRQQMKPFEGMNIDEVENSTTESAEEVATENETTHQEIEQEAPSNVSTEQQNALNRAKEYLELTAFSHSSLVEQLEFEGYSNESAVFAADNCGADWNEQAAKKAKDYMDFSSFSRQGLIEQLVFEGFTNEQAEFGVSAVGY
ncbi:MAG: Ltp family lipoprotein [Blautia sp.]|nr:Ltp family lipoprotein [Blautia sp.]